MTRARLTRAFFACLTIVYLLVYPYLQGINNPNENTRIYLTMALVEEGSFFLDGMVRRHGWTNDMARVETPTGPHFASVKGPAVSYLGVPVYVAQRAVLGLFGRHAPTAASPPRERAAWLRTTTLTLQLCCVHLPCLVFLVAFERVLRRLTSDLSLRLAAVAAVGLGTNFLAYAFVFVSHALVAVAAFSAFAGVFVDRSRFRGEPSRATPARAFVVGLGCGLVTLFEYQGLFVSAVLFVYAATLYRTRRTLPALVLGVVPSVIGLLVFQAKSFGHALTPGHRMMDSSSFRELNSKGFFTLGLPSFDALAGLLFDGGYGLFGASPYLCLACLAFVRFRRRSGSLRSDPTSEREPSSLVAALVFLALVLPVSASAIWRGGWTIGPRYLGALPPFLGFLAVVGLARLAKRSSRVRALARGFSAGLAAVSFASLGLVGLVVSTLPEAVARPLPQVAWPFLRAGLVPHHALELVGLAAPWPFFLAPLAAIGALVLVLVAARTTSPSRQVSDTSSTNWTISLGVAALTLALGLGLVTRVPETARAAEPAVYELFRAAWEPRFEAPPAARVDQK